MLAALLEWFLWIAAFLYCLGKVFVKAEHWTVRVLAVLVGTVFTLLRYVFQQVDGQWSWGLTFVDASSSPS